MKKFRLPRKEKKKLRKGFWLYPLDNNYYRRATPYRKEEDYLAMKKGIVTNHFTKIKTKEEKEAEKQKRKRLQQPIFIPDNQLREFVNDIFVKGWRGSSYETLILAKKKFPFLYFEFINSYLVSKENNCEDKYCIFIVDWARMLMKKQKKKKNKRRK